MIYIPIIFSEICVIICYLLRIGEYSMLETVLSIVLAAAAILGPIATIIIASINLSKKLGNFDEKTLKCVIDEDIIKNAIGFHGGESGKSLSEQHEKIICELNKRDKAISKKLKSLNADSKKIYETAKDVNLIMEDWLDLKSEHDMLTNKVIELTDCLNAEKENSSQLAKALADTKQENELLREKNNELIRQYENLSDKLTELISYERSPGLNFQTEMEGGDEEIDEDELEL